MRTTVNINDAILRDLRARAEANGVTFRQELEEALALGLAQLTKAPAREPFRIRPHPLGLKPGFHGVSLNQLYDQLEAEDSTHATCSCPTPTC